MSKRQARRLEGVLHNFLGTYTSRYTERDGFWLFGFLSQDVRRGADLLEHGPAEDWERIGRERFGEQIAEARTGPVVVAKMQLDWEGSAEQVVNGVLRKGRWLSILVRAQTVGAHAERQIRIFVAPHNPSIERRSARAMDR